MSNRPLLTIFFVVFLIAILVGVVNYIIMESYFNVQPIWVENVAYVHWYNLNFLSALTENGFWPAIWRYVMDGSRHLLQLMVLGFLSPSLLGWFHGHLLFHIALFGIFLSFFAWTVYRITNNLFFSLAVTLLFISLRELPNEKWGIGAGFADYQSMLLLSTGVLCLINALIKPKIGWIKLFALFVSLAILARTTAMFFSLVIVGPIFLLYLFKIYQEEKSLKSIFYLLINVFLILIPVVLIVVRQLFLLLWYYGSSNAIGLRHSYLISFLTIIKLFANYVGLPTIFLTLFIFFKNLKFKFKFKFDSITFAVSWWLFGYLGFLFINGYWSDVPKEVMYAIPPFILLAVYPLTLKDKMYINSQKSVTMGIIIFSLFSFSWNSYQSWIRIGKVSDFNKQYRQSQIELASQLSKLPEETIWQSYTNPDWGIPVSVLTYYKYSRYIKAYNELFHNNKNYWDARYPNLSLIEIQNKVYKQTLDCIDAAIVLKDPLDKPDSMEDYSFQIASAISQKILTDNNWQYYASIKGEPFGSELAIYLNTAKELGVCKVS